MILYSITTFLLKTHSHTTPFEKLDGPGDKTFMLRVSLVDYYYREPHIFTK